MKPIDPVFTKCKHCHLFVEPQEKQDGSGWFHLSRADAADQQVEESHQAEGSDQSATLTMWKQFGPPAMLARFLDATPGQWLPVTSPQVRGQHLLGCSEADLVRFVGEISIPKLLQLDVDDELDTLGFLDDEFEERVLTAVLNARELFGLQVSVWPISEDSSWAGALVTVDATNDVRLSSMALDWKCLVDRDATGIALIRSALVGVALTARRLLSDLRTYGASR